MPLYRFQARTQSGQIQTGTLAADNAMTAAAILRNQGQRVVHLTPIQGGTAGRGLLATLKSLNYSSGPSQRDVLDFTTQLAVMIRAGISLRSALDGIAQQAPNPKWKAILQNIKQDVEGGKQFSEAIVRYPKQFNHLYVNMVRASEMSGSFARMLDRIAVYMQQQLETRKMVIGAMIYPGIIATMAVGVTVFLLTFVLPRFAMVFKGKEKHLPKPTIFLMALSDFMVNYWYILLIAAAVVLVGLFMFLRTRVGRLWFDHFKLMMPVLRRMFRALYVSRSMHTMSELLGAGVPMLDALAITGDVTGNLLYRRLWRAVYSSVKEGKKLVHPLQNSQLYPVPVVQMIGAGEESGKLADVMSEIATFYSRVLSDAIKLVTSMIEPIMIIAMGSVVGFIAMAIILPIFKMSSLVK